MKIRTGSYTDGLVGGDHEPRSPWMVSTVVGSQIIELTDTSHVLIACQSTFLGPTHEPLKGVPNRISFEVIYNEHVRCWPLVRETEPFLDQFQNPPREGLSCIRSFYLLRARTEFEILTKAMSIEGNDAPVFATSKARFRSLIQRSVRLSRLRTDPELQKAWKKLEGFIASS